MGTHEKVSLRNGIYRGIGDSFLHETFARLPHRENIDTPTKGDLIGPLSGMEPADFLWHVSQKCCKKCAPNIRYEHEFTPISYECCLGCLDGALKTYVFIFTIFFILYIFLPILFSSLLFLLSIAFICSLWISYISYITSIYTLSLSVFYPSAPYLFFTHFLSFSLSISYKSPLITQIFYL